MKPPTVPAVLAALMLAACAVPPPTSQRVTAHEAAADAAGTLLLVDVCLNYSPLGTDDYFVIDKAREGARAIEAVTLQFLDAADVRARTTLIPFVCGAVHDPANAPKRVAEAADGPVSTRPQPVWVAAALQGDAEYLAALQTLATHVFKGSLAAYDKDPKKPEGPAPATAADDAERVRQASMLVAQRTGRSALLYLGVTGHSLSSGKTASFAAARIVAGVTISLAIGPVFTIGGVSYGVIFIPGGPVDKRQMAAGLFDLRQAQLLRSRVVGAGGDPMKPEVLADRNALNLLLGDLLLTTAPR
jgi:hypothetical protein